MQRFLFTVSYLGTRYAGWQRQANALAVQEVIERALNRLCKAPVRIEGAGRTDSGVHALGQRAHADIPVDIDSTGLVRGLNDLLPADIRICSAVTVPNSFHARFEASAKTYQYRIWNAEVNNVFLASTHAHVRQPLDEGRMREAMAPLSGRHDFRAFTVRVPEVSSTVRTIQMLQLIREEKAIRITVRADGFLRFMVRRIAGSLIEVGRGKEGVDSLSRSLEPAFETARWTAPPEGLTLLRIDYERGPDRLESSDAVDELERESIGNSDDLREARRGISLC